MKTGTIGITMAALTGLLLGIAGPASGQVHAHAHVHRPFAAHVIVPQARSFNVDRKTQVQITGVKAGVVILGQAATTTMDIELRNPTNRRVEAELLVPVPDGAAVRGFTFQGAGKEPSAVMLPKDKAVGTYKAIVNKMRDPALLEFVGYNLIRSSVFPLEPRGTQKVRLTYEHLLAADGDRVDYALPRSESIHYNVPWEISVKITATRPISTIYSPSHVIDQTRKSPKVVNLRVTKQAANEPGPFQLSYLIENNGGVTASLLAYPDPKTGGGYFLLLAGLPAGADKSGLDGTPPTVKREVTIVIDRSGSMGGEKIAQAKAAALQVIEGLHKGEAFNIIDYSDSIATFAPAPVIKNARNIDQARHYIRRLSSGGGTNIHDTLVEALRQKPVKGMLPIVLFLTDGLPTVGVRSEVTIRETVIKANVHHRRVFTFGVGYDVNVPLLTHLADHSRAVPTYVMPNEDVEVKVSQVYRRLFGPVMSAPTLTSVDRSGEPVTRRVSELLPGKLPDLFEGDKLVLLGKYSGEEPLRFVLKGSYRGKRKTFKFNFKLNKATTKNSFVPRLWASRKIAVLIDEIRQSGADTGGAASVLAATAATAATDPKMKELVDEIVKLSIEFGVLTEYTAFLAREGTDLARRDMILREANGNFETRARGTRVGIGAFNQGVNDNFQRQQIVGNRLNGYVDANMNRVQITNVQQINDRAFFQRGNRWVDGNAINSDRGATPDKTIAFGSPEFMKLLEQLRANNRNGALSLSGEILLRVGNDNILVTTK